MRKVKKFNDEDSSTKEKWRKMKEETGQNQFTSPAIIVEGKNHNVSPRDIAKSLNRQYISKIRKVIQKIPETETNPLTLYDKVAGRPNGSFTFTQISMDQLRKEISMMRPTTATGQDEI